MNKLFKSKKGLTLIELLVTLLLVSIIVVFIYRLILNLNNQTTNPEFAMSNQTIRTEIIRTIESDLVSHDIDKILLVYQDQDNNYNPSVYFYEQEKSGIVSILDEQAIQYKSFSGELQTWELIDCFVHFDSAEKGENSGIVINSNGIGNSTSSVSLNIVVSNDNEHNSGITSPNNNLKDDILISYLGHSNNLSFCSKESSHKPEECRKYVLIYLDYNYPHRETESLVSTDQVVGEKIELPTDLRTDGYQFEGWYDSKAGGNKIDPNKIATLADENLTIYAHWKALDYTVTFDTNGGNPPDPASKKVTFDAKYGDLATVTRRGYTFVGWYMGRDNSSQQVTKDSYVKTPVNHTLYAHWKPNVYTVTFNKNGSDKNPTPATKDVTYDATYGTLASISRTGYTFDGWWTEPDGGTQITASTKVQIIENQTLYAHWKANVYTVTFNANGGKTPTPTSIQVTYDKSYGTLATVSRTGYTFTGWYTEASGGTKVESTTTLKTAKNHTLYAHWTANQYTITLNSTVATTNGTPASVKATYDSSNMSAAITNPKRVYSITFAKGSSGATLSATSATSTWTFTGWWTAQTGGVKVIGTDGSFVANVSGYTNASRQWVKADNVTLYAQWSGGTITIPTVTRTGYNCTLGAITNPPTANKTYTATCSANAYTVTFNANGGGTPSPTSKTVTYDAAYGTLASISRTGYTFNGWYTAASGGTKIESTTTVKITANQTLYAHWTANQYTITLTNKNATTAGTTSVKATYDSANLSATITNPKRVYTITFKPGTPAATLSATSATSTWTFTGWWTAETGGTKVIGTDGKLIASVSGYTNASKQWIKVGNVTLYAQWSGGTITVPTPTRTGYSCSLPTVTNPPTADKTYTATCKANAYTVTFNANGGGTPNPTSKTVTYDAAYGTLASISRTGYTFNGWYTAASGGTKIESTTTVKITANQTLYAHWTANQYTITLNSNGATSVGTASVKTTYDSSGLSATITNPKRVYTINFAAGSPAATLSATSATSTWTFTGWWTAASGGTKVIGTDGNLIANVSGYTNGSRQWIKTSNVTLYAQWSGGTITVPTPTRTGYSCTFGTVTNPPTANKTYTATCTDNVNPTISCTKSNTGTTAGVTVTCTCKDNGSGVTSCAGSTFGATASKTITLTGVKATTNYTVKDASGRTVTTSVTVTPQVQTRTKSCSVGKRCSSAACETYKNCANSACGVASYKRCASAGCETNNTCRTAACGVESYKSCRTAACGVESYKSCATSGCGCQTYKRGTSCSCETYNSCAASACGVASYKTCRTSGCGCQTYRAGSVCGVASYNSCRTSGCGCQTYNSCRVSSCGCQSYRTCTNSACGNTTRTYSGRSPGCGGGCSNMGGAASLGSGMYRWSCTCPNSCATAACGCATYNSCRNSSCGCATYNSCQSSACGVASYRRCASAGCETYNSCANSACGVASYNTCRTSACGCQTYSRCSAAGCETYNTCANSACGVNQYKSCTNSACGVNQYKSCTHADCGCSVYKRGSACGVESYNTCRTSACGCETYSRNTSKCGCETWGGWSSWTNATSCTAGESSDHGTTRECRTIYN